MQFPITIGLHRSRLAGRILLASAVLAALGLGVAPWPIYWQGMALLALIAVSHSAWRRLRPEWSRLVLETPGVFRLESGVSACLVGSPHVHPWLTVFQLQDEAGKTCRLMLTVDSLDAADFRRLRSVLRHAPSRRVSDVGESGA